MRNSVLSMLLLLCFCVSYGAPVMERTTLKVKDYDEFYLSGGVNTRLVYHPDSVGMVVITCPKTDYSNFKLSHTGTALDIRYESKQAPATGTALTVYTPSVMRVISLTGRARLSVSGLSEARNMNVMLTGSGCIELVNSIARTLRVFLTGSGSIRLEGNTDAETISLENTGSGSISVPSVAARTVSATLSGNGTVTVGGNSTGSTLLSLKGSGKINASALHNKSLKASAYGNGTIDIHETPNADLRGRTENIKTVKAILNNE